MLPFKTKLDETFLICETHITVQQNNKVQSILQGGRAPPMKFSEQCVPHRIGCVNNLSTTLYLLQCVSP